MEYMLFGPGDVAMFDKWIDKEYQELARRDLTAETFVLRRRKA